MKENPTRSLPGIPMLLAFLVALLVAAFALFAAVNAGQTPLLAAALLLGVAAVLCLFGLYMVEPNAGSQLS